MKKHLNKQFGTAFLGTLGTFCCVMIVKLMVEGKLQEIVPFRGPMEEMVFTLFAATIGVIFLAMTLSAAFPKK